jgi:hypothetical protein
MKLPLTDAQLDDLLHREFATATVPDDGFSARVLHALPPRRRQRRWLLPSAVLIGALLAWLSLLPSPLLQQATREWATSNLHLSSVVVWALLLGVSLLGCAWALEEEA